MFRTYYDLANILSDPFEQGKKRHKTHIYLHNKVIPNNFELKKIILGRLIT